MKLVLVLGFAMLALSLPAAAAAPAIVDSAEASIQATAIDGTVPFLNLMVKPPISCENLTGTSCTSVGATQGCKDVCGYSYVCTCTQFGSIKYWACPYTC